MLLWFCHQLMRVISWINISAIILPVIYQILNTSTGSVVRCMPKLICSLINSACVWLLWGYFYLQHFVSRCILPTSGFRTEQAACRDLMWPIIIAWDCVLNFQDGVLPAKYLCRCAYLLRHNNKSNICASCLFQKMVLFRPWLTPKWSRSDFHPDRGATGAPVCMWVQFADICLFFIGICISIALYSLFFILVYLYAYYLAFYGPSTVSLTMSN